MQFIDNKGFIHEERWSDDRYINPLRLRNSRARALRKDGWTVKCGMTDFTDLARCRVYWLEAEKEKIEWLENTPI